jgi:hypothetical protein
MRRQLENNLRITSCDAATISRVGRIIADRIICANTDQKRQAGIDPGLCFNSSAPLHWTLNQIAGKFRANRGILWSAYARLVYPTQGGNDRQCTALKSLALAPWDDYRLPHISLKVIGRCVPCW